jgi:uncharacterized membrane protein
MTSITESIEVKAPLSTVYNQWTQFEDFPQFMEGVERVDQLDDQRLHWVTKIAGVQREFDAKVTEQHPDQKVAWRTLDGPEHAGVVTFAPASDGQTKVNLQMDYDPDGFVENAGDKLGVVSARVKGDLRRFRDFIEARGAETGAWRGDVEPGNTSSL